MLMGHQMDDSLDSNWSFLLISKDDTSSLELINNMGASCGAFPIFIAYP